MILERSNVLLTGASSGIGRALARELVGRTGRLAITARREIRLEDMADELEAGHGTRPVVLVADLAQPGAGTELAERAREAMGGVDVLINNAGSAIQGMQWAAGDGTAARELFETNVWSPLALTAALVPAMRARGEGAIVNVTSLLQVSPFPSFGHTSASKAALALATQTLELELTGSGVHVLEAVLGPVDTPGAFESRLMPGGKQWLHATGLATAEGAARHIVKALEHERRRVVYPRRLSPTYALPVIGRRFARWFTRYADPNDLSVRRGGSAGDLECRAMRARWEEHRSGSPMHGPDPPYGGAITPP